MENALLKLSPLKQFLQKRCFLQLFLQFLIFFIWFSIVSKTYLGMVDNSWETIEKHLACFWEQKQCFPLTKPNIIYVEVKSGEGKANDCHHFTIAFYLI